MTQKETAEERRNIEYSTCEEWLEKIRHIRHELEDDEGINATETNMIVEQMQTKLEEMEYAIMGRMAELDEFYCTEYEREYSFSRLYRKQAELARENGVNFVALWRYLSMYEIPKAIEYIKDKELASMSYEKTCDAVERYCSEEYGRKHIA